MEKAGAIPTKVVLFDVDGVLYRNKPTLIAVRKKIIAYVKTRIERSQKRYISFKEAEGISDSLYKRYGHTLRGMHHLYGSVHEFPVEQFNNYVYDDEIINMLTTGLAGSEPNEDLDKYVHLCKRNHSDIQFGIFSNAPSSWCKPIVSHLGLEVNPELIFTSSHILFNNRMKPDASLYKDIAAEIETNHELPIRFIDDSDINIATAMNMPEWTSVKFTTDY